LAFRGVLGNDCAAVRAAALSVDVFAPCSRNIRTSFTFSFAVQSKSRRLSSRPYIGWSTANEDHRASASSRASDIHVTLSLGVQARTLDHSPTFAPEAALETRPQSVLAATANNPASAIWRPSGLDGSPRRGSRECQPAMCECARVLRPESQHRILLAVRD